MASIMTDISSCTIKVSLTNSRAHGTCVLNSSKRTDISPSVSPWNRFGCCTWECLWDLHTPMLCPPRPNSNAYFSERGEAELNRWTMRKNSCIPSCHFGGSVLLRSGTYLRSGHWTRSSFSYANSRLGCWLQFQVCPPPHSSEGRTAVEYQWISFPIPQATGCNS